VTTQDVGVEKKRASFLSSSIIARARERAPRNRTRRGARRGHGVCPESNFVTPGRYLRAHLARERARAFLRRRIISWRATKWPAAVPAVNNRPATPAAAAAVALSLSLSLPPSRFILSRPAFHRDPADPIRARCDGRVRSWPWTTQQICLLPIAHLYRYPAGISIPLYRYRLYLESRKIAPPLRIRLRTYVRYGKLPFVIVFDRAANRTRRTENPIAFPSFISDCDRSGIVEERCAILEETVVERGTKADRRFSEKRAFSFPFSRRST